MKQFVYSYDSENERVTIRADDKVIGTLSKIKIENAALAMYQVMYNFKKEKMIYRRFITKSTLKNRGWSNGMINMFYKKPTYIVPNPHYSTAFPMKLYSITKVKRIERLQEFKDYMSKIAHKREVARAMMIERHKKAKELILVPHTYCMSNQRA